MEVWTHQMRHNFIICLQEPHLHKHRQANVWAVTASQNAFEGSPMDSLVALARQVWVMSDVIIGPDAKGTLQRHNQVSDHDQHDGTIPTWDLVHQSWDYANPKTTAFHASCSHI